MKRILLVLFVVGVLLNACDITNPTRTIYETEYSTDTLVMVDTVAMDSLYFRVVEDTNGDSIHFVFADTTLNYAYYYFLDTLYDTTVLRDTDTIQQYFRDTMMDTTLRYLFIRDTLCDTVSDTIKRYIFSTDTVYRTQYHTDTVYRTQYDTVSHYDTMFISTSCPVQVITDESLFNGQNIPMGFSDQKGLQLSFSGIDITAPNAKVAASGWSIIFDYPTYNEGGDGATPTIPYVSQGFITANGEDDFLITPVVSCRGIGLRYVSNYNGVETFIVRDASGILLYEGTGISGSNAIKFIGFKSSCSIGSIRMETSGGASQNVGIEKIFVTY